jgi:hypothetical protein
MSRAGVDGSSSVETKETNSGRRYERETEFLEFHVYVCMRLESFFPVVLLLHTCRLVLAPRSNRCQCTACRGAEHVTECVL